MAVRQEQTQRCPIWLRQYCGEEAWYLPVSWTTLKSADIPALPLLLLQGIQQIERQADCSAVQNGA